MPVIRGPDTRFFADRIPASMMGPGFPVAFMAILSPVNPHLNARRRSIAG